MTGIEQQVAALKRRIADEARARASAEGQRAVAVSRREEAERELREAFGVSPEQVPALLRQLEDDLAAEARRVTEWLDKAEEKKA